MILKVRGQSLKLEGGVIAEGAVDFATFEIKSDSAWRELIKTARFKRYGENKVYDTADVKDGEVYYLPRELLRQGKVEVSLVGVNGEGVVATTEKKRFTIKGSVDGGSTPAVSEDAYAKYVSDVLYLKERCENAEKKSVDAENVCSKARDSVEKTAFEMKKILSECRDILANVSGALDAVGVAFKEIKDTEKILTSKNSDLDIFEAKRDSFERARVVAEREREKREEERRDAERERKLIESARSTSEKMRALREEIILGEMKDMRERLDALEKSEPFFFTEALESDEYLLDENTLENKVTGETLFLSSPLLQVGEVFDSVEMNGEETKVIRRLTSVIISDNAEIIEEGTLFAVLLETSGNGEPIGRASHLLYGEEVFVKGELLFFTSFDSAEALRAFLKENAPFEVLYPALKEKVEILPPMTLPECAAGVEVNADGNTTVFYKKSLTETLSEINKKLKGEKI